MEPFKKKDYNIQVVVFEAPTVMRGKCDRLALYFLNSIIDRKVEKNVFLYQEDCLLGSQLSESRRKMFSGLFEGERGRFSTLLSGDAREFCSNLAVKLEYAIRGFLNSHHTDSAYRFVVEIAMFGAYGEVFDEPLVWTVMFERQLQSSHQKISATGVVRKVA